MIQATLSRLSRDLRHLLGRRWGGFTVSATPITLHAKDGCPLTTYSLEGPRRWGFGDRKCALVFYVPGSHQQSPDAWLSRLAGFVMMNMQVIVIERRGVLPEGRLDTPALRQAAQREVRALDAQTAIQMHIDRARPRTPIIAVGGSEGGDIVAAVATRERRITHLALLGAGGGWSQALEFSHFVRTRGSYLGIRSLDELEHAFQQIRERPDSEECWLGHSFRHWNSYLWHTTVDGLLELDIPIFMAHGARDESVPVESARAAQERLALAGRTRVRYQEYPSLDHFFFDATIGRSGLPLIEYDAIEWLCETDVLTQTQMRRFQDRVRRNHAEWFPAT